MGSSCERTERVGSISSVARLLEMRNKGLLCSEPFEWHACAGSVESEAGSREPGAGSRNWFVDRRVRGRPALRKGMYGIAVTSALSEKLLDALERGAG